MCLYVGEKVGREGEKEETNSSKRKMKKRLTNDSLRCIIQQVKAVFEMKFSEALFTLQMKIHTI